MVKFVTTLSAKFNALKQRVIKVNVMGSGDTQTALQASPHGIDSNPVKDMIAIYSQSNGMGDTVIVGYINKNQIADVGETRIYSTDSEGVLKTAIHLKNDGIIEFGGNSDFMVRFSALETAFNELQGIVNTHVHTANNTPTVTPSIGDISLCKINNIKTS